MSERSRVHVRRPRSKAKENVDAWKSAAMYREQIGILKHLVDETDAWAVEASITSLSQVQSRTVYK